jgi:3-methyl-2-oxobutanoate hydroxymethyltransferase
VTAHQKAAALGARKGGLPIAALTAYDYPTARLLDDSGVDVLLVGDSLGMVVLGFPDTTHVTLDHMLHHVAAVARARPKALVIGDLPIHSYDTPAMALDTARQLVAAGAEAVKLEGGIRQAEKVRAITSAGIPVVGHLGMLPQRVIEEGGYHKKGKTPEQSDALREGAQALIDAGVFAIILESVIPATARELTASLPGLCRPSRSPRQISPTAFATPPAITSPACKTAEPSRAALPSHSVLSPDLPLLLVLQTHAGPILRW